jgi:DNA-binding SARP family transcriptional activator
MQIDSEVRGADLDMLRQELGRLSDYLSSLEADLRHERELVQRLSSRLESKAGPESHALSETSASPAPSHDAPTAPDGSKDCAPTSLGLRIFCFGSFEVLNGAHTISLPRASKDRAILKLMALRPRQPLLRDVLLETLWPNVEPVTAQNRLRVVMHHLRQLFSPATKDKKDPGWILFQDGCYFFNPDIRIWSDVEEFESLWQTGVRSERAGGLVQALPHYLQAEALYRSDLLEEDLFEEWTLLRRDELKDTYMSILAKLGRHWLQVGNHDAAIEEWKKILGKDPWREDIYRRLMAHTAHRGQRGLALRWYQICAQALHTQLELEPEPETMMLHEHIVSGKDLSKWVGD